MLLIRKYTNQSTGESKYSLVNYHNNKVNIIGVMCKEGVKSYIKASQVKCIELISVKDVSDLKVKEFNLNMI